MLMAKVGQAKKEAVTDGIKRTLRTFGNVLGMCLYDKRFLTDIKKVKVPPVSPASRLNVCVCVYRDRPVRLMWPSTLVGTTIKARGTLETPRIRSSSSSVGSSGSFDSTSSDVGCRCAEGSGDGS
jgi:hypothetical protein